MKLALALLLLLSAACTGDEISTTIDPVEPIAWNAPYCYAIRDSAIVALDFQTETITPIGGLATQTTTDSGIELDNTFGIAERNNEIAVVGWQGIAIHDATTGAKKAMLFANEHLRGLSCHDAIPPVL